MSHLGLPLLPSSVLTKSPVAEAIADSQGGFSIVKSIVRTLRGSFLNPQGIFLLLMVSLMYCGWALTAAEVERRNVAVVAGVANFGLFVHALAGRYGWFARYEVYAVAIGLPYFSRCAIGFRNRGT
jgi:hypothetical protein